MKRNSGNWPCSTKKIDAYLERRDLLPSEIRDLAEAKYNMINCFEVLHDRMHYEHMEGLANGEDFE